MGRDPSRRSTRASRLHMCPSRSRSWDVQNVYALRALGRRGNAVGEARLFRAETFTALTLVESALRAYLRRRPLVDQPIENRRRRFRCPNDGACPREQFCLVSACHACARRPCARRGTSVVRALESAVTNGIRPPGKGSPISSWGRARDAQLVDGVVTGVRGRHDALRAPRSFRARQGSGRRSRPR